MRGRRLGRPRGTDRRARPAVPRPVIWPEPAIEVLAAGFRQATHPIVKGFMVGRTLWPMRALAWTQGEIDDAALVEQVARNFATLVVCMAREPAPPEGCVMSTTVRLTMRRRWCGTSPPCACKRPTAPLVPYCGGVVDHLRSRQCRGHRRSAARAARRVATWPRKRARHGACRGGLCQGALPAPHDGRQTSIGRAHQT